MARGDFKLGHLGWAILLRALPGALAAGFSLNQQQLAGGACLVLAVWADVGVGFLAGRMGWRKTISQIQIEALVDFICFVVAPLIFCFTQNRSLAVQVASLPFLLCGAFRIARFNVEGLNQQGAYDGLPVTYNGYWFPLFALLEQFHPLYAELVWGCVLLLLSFLMTTRRLNIPEL